MINTFLSNLSNQKAHLVYCSFFALSFFVQFICMYTSCKKNNFNRNQTKWMLVFIPISYIGGLVICRILSLILAFAIPCNSAAAYAPYLMIYGLILAPKIKISRWHCCDIVAPVYIMARATLILGCLFPGCCYGPSVSWGLFRHHLETTVVPVRLFESIASLLLCTILCVIQKKWFQKPAGIITAWSTIVFGALGYLTDMIRINEVKLFGMTSCDGINAILTMIAGLVLLYIVDKKQTSETTVISNLSI